MAVFVLTTAKNKLKMSKNPLGILINKIIINSIVIKYSIVNLITFHLILKYTINLTARLLFVYY